MKKKYNIELNANELFLLMGTIDYTIKMTTTFKDHTFAYQYIPLIKQINKIIRTNGFIK